MNGYTGLGRLTMTKILAPDVPTPERLRAWADWLEADERKPIGVTVADGNAWIASYLLRLVAAALERQGVTIIGSPDTPGGTFP